MVVLNTLITMLAGISSSWAMSLPLGDAVPQLPMTDDGIPTIFPVPITLGVMSQCPDAFTCEAIFGEVLEAVGHERVQIELTYVAHLNETDPKYGVSCKHGDLECAGNVHELCVAQHRPNSRDWWPFVECVNHRGGAHGVGLPSVSKECARSSGIDWEADGIAECVEGEEGPRLLRDSVMRTRELGITKSCTMVINNKVRCIRDGAWIGCEDGHEPGDFVRIINREYGKLNPSR